MFSFEAFKKQHMEYLNKNFSKVTFIVECGDEIILATDDRREAYEKANDAADVMDAYIYQRDPDLGFKLAVTFHAQALTVEFKPEDLAALATAIKNS